MRDGETIAAARRVPLELDDGAGSAYTGTAPTGSEVLISISGAAFQTAAGTVTKLRNGDFYYEATEAETRGRGMRLLRLAKTGMGTAIYDWYCGDRHAADPSNEARRIPVMLETNAGVAVTGIVLSGSEIEISVNGAAFTTGAGSAAEIGYGAYYYQPTVAEYTRGFSLLYVNDAGAEIYRYEIEVGQAISPALSGTTAASVRDRIAAVITALLPTRLSGDKFREHRNEQSDFMEWCAANPTGAFRRFQVIDTGSDEPPETSNVLEEERRATFQVIVAYPQTARTGSQQSLDRQDAMREDQRIIERAIGMHGAANFSDPYPDATWLSGATDRETDGVCDYLVITQVMSFVVRHS